MYNETFTPIYRNGDIHLKPGQSHAFHFDGTSLPHADRLFFTGETALFYQWKDEPDYPLLYRYIDDSLNAREAHRDQYCLDFSADDFDYPKIAFRKACWPIRLSYLSLVDYTDHWKISLDAKAKDLHISKGGFLHFLFEIRYLKDGVDSEATIEEPDKVISIDIPEGSYDWRHLEKEIVFDAHNVANICCILEGEHYSGSVYFEAPTLLSENGFNVLPDFAPFTGTKSQFNWLGVNLSKKEWPSFEITLNGRLLHKGELFERCHRYSENEIVVPKGAMAAGDNELTFKLISDYHNALAYNVHEVGFVSHDDSLVVSVPEVVRSGSPFPVLLRTKHDNETVVYDLDGEKGSKTFEKAGLNVLAPIAPGPGHDLPLTVGSGDHHEHCRLSRCVLHEDDGVHTGTSDFIYINQNPTSFEDYLSWYFSSHIGDFITIRQDYRWAGTRARNDKLWQATAKLLNDAGYVYAHMEDGRELPGFHMNPTWESLRGKGFLGRHLHERDGAIGYWGIREVTGDPNEQMYLDLAGRMHRAEPGTGGKDGKKVDQFYRDGRHTVFRDPTVPPDMEAAAAFFVGQLSRIRGLATRHTGPTPLFKYFRQAGFTLTGAELMYNPMDITRAAVRGTSNAYGGPKSSHLAVQGSTSPHDTEERYRRYRLALFICYIQGVDQINTEEGLWHLEEYYQHHHRFSPACRNHLRQQQDLQRFIATHSRTGRFHTPVAFLSGRLDGWTCGWGTVWGQPGFTPCDAEKSWELIRYFYPRSVLGVIYRHGCKNEPMGYYTGTPIGNVDIIPIESEKSFPYRLLIASGYNKALPEDMDKLQSYVEKGGTLLLGWPQLSVTTNRDDVVAYRHAYIDHPFAKALADKPDFVADTFGGKPLTVSAHKISFPVLLETDGGRPLVYEVPMGKGRVLFLNAREYAGNEAVHAACQRLFDQIVPPQIAQEAIYGKGDKNVQFTVFEQEDGSRHLYFIATDWYDDPAMPHEGTLLMNGKRYAVDVPFGRLVKIVARDDTAVWPGKDCDEVLSIENGTARVQGIGRAVFHIATQGSIRDITVDFEEQAVREITL